MIKIINQTKIHVNEEGYLTDFEEWNVRIGEYIAREHDIVLTLSHWDIISWIQEQFKAKKSLSLRGIRRSGITSIKELYNLFPGGPLKISAKIAGVPKPTNCI
ncbi:TusE/DsrC/DsvC family sulfur relay protein [Polaribacter sp. Z022]|uniref:TusE/DsrC/DsvC family sulfur relay protein n=1 Tax=Polaribacter sp. Z022 TaxID=2927125 RepID=UPI00202199EF|nr:TusE/DsrC/DsvC family sulfur relay protein [Polaribacter sp. Z022]MCL7753470.1 TusE/DsrC/DsvC family sulfur relay protein [Polaribacter sp. Z022]